MEKHIERLLSCSQLSEYLQQVLLAARPSLTNSVIYKFCSLFLPKVCQASNHSLFMPNVCQLPSQTSNHSLFLSKVRQLASQTSNHSLFLSKSVS